MNTVLFDLDGTLLPMDLEDFMQAYFGAIGKKSAENGYNPKELVAGDREGCDDHTEYVCC